jgi:hypothetical protein
MDSCSRYESSNEMDKNTSKLCLNCNGEMIERSPRNCIVVIVERS